MGMAMATEMATEMATAMVMAMAMVMATATEMATATARPEPARNPRDPNQNETAPEGAVFLSPDLGRISEIVRPNGAALVVLGASDRGLEQLVNLVGNGLD